jgi:hypothetical protein
MAIFLALMCAFTENSNIGIQTKAHGIYAFVILYNAFYGATWGPMPWLLPAEVFPMRARSTGVAFSTCSNWYVVPAHLLNSIYRDLSNESKGFQFCDRYFFARRF